MKKSDLSISDVCQDLEMLEAQYDRLEKENNALRWTMVLAYAGIVIISVYWCWRIYFG